VADYECKQKSKQFILLITVKRQWLLVNVMYPLRSM